MDKKTSLLLVFFFLVIAGVGSVMYWALGSSGESSASSGAFKDLPGLSDKAQLYELLWTKDDGVYYFQKDSPKFITADTIFCNIIYVPTRAVVDNLIMQDVDTYRDFAYANCVYVFSKDDRGMFYIDEINRYTKNGEVIEAISGVIRPVERIYPANGSPERKFRNTIVTKMTG